MNWRSLVWRIATWLAGPQPVNVKVKVNTSVRIRDDSEWAQNLDAQVPDQVRLERSLASTGRSTGVR